MSVLTVTSEKNMKQTNTQEIKITQKTTQQQQQNPNKTHTLMHARNQKQFKHTKENVTIILKHKSTIARTLK